VALVGFTKKIKNGIMRGMIQGQFLRPGEGSPDIIEKYNGETISNVKV